jgi:hypothetical protein
VRLQLLVILTRLIYNNTSRLTGSLALSVAYGIRTETADNEYIRLYRKMINSLGRAVVPGAFVVDVFPPRESHPLNVGDREPVP